MKNERWYNQGLFTIRGANLEFVCDIFAKRSSKQFGSEATVYHHKNIVHIIREHKNWWKSGAVTLKLNTIKSMPKGIIKRI